MSHSINLYCLNDPIFPKNFDGDPSEKVLNGMLLQQKLHILYSKKLKQQSEELFKRKINEAEVLPEYAAIEKVIRKVSVDVANFLEDLEETLVPRERLACRYKKKAAQKYVSTLELLKFETTQYLMTKLSAR